ncbi:hypothetical protein CHLNCDRAFT_142743 [Chlorella variabilis]|uniref:Uncharacterized protein n=1 Tax=Chlorella variabilis TaxID=554065 RepID=E1Z8M6_CHLVA|nr:hypothetical protein CHLNCDRAFT_142743 [Chlorella variabilis]EFN57364.1 hypothetical protein CHLNCDRAFT_142743 [Chlorella variabilis]|eukprot:XP_005849466.1 hypothetical protein CHLNCDRAFT_142743 [Chlorella variabilis]
MPWHPQLAPLLLVLALCASPAVAVASVAIPAGELGSPDYQNNKRKLFEQNSTQSTQSSEAATFEVAITCDQPGPTTHSALPLWTVDFGRALEQPNPLSLFRVSGVYRVDVVYQQSEGLLYVLGFVATRDDDVELSITIPAGAASDDAGALNAEASAAITYQPPPSGVGMGPVGRPNFAQTFYYSGTLPISNMPQNYRAVSNTFGWTSLTTAPAVGGAASAPSPDALSQAEDNLYSKQRFPYPPVVVVPVSGGDDDGAANGTSSASGGGGSGEDGTAGGGGSGDGLPERAVLVPISAIEGQLGGAGNIFDGPLPADASSQLPDAQATAGGDGGDDGTSAPTDGAAAADGSSGGAGAGSQPGSQEAGDTQQDGDALQQSSAEEQEGGAGETEGGVGGDGSGQGEAQEEGQEGGGGQGQQPNPFDPEQVDDPAYQNPPPEPDLPPAQQQQQVEEQQREQEQEQQGQTPTPEGQTPTPEGQGQTPTPDGMTPTPDGQTPTPDGQTPTPDGQTPTPDWQTPTPDGQTPTPDGQTPTPDWQTPDGQTLTPDGQPPTPDGQTPTPDGQTPTPDGQTPTPEGEPPTPEGQTPTPEGQTPTPDGSGSPSPPPPENDGSANPTAPSPPPPNNDVSNPSGPSPPPPTKLGGVNPTTPSPPPPDGGDQHAGSGVLVPASYVWSETLVQTLQTFGILLSVTKMVLFALIINSVGSVNSVPQLAAEMVASLCDLAVFVCGIILIAKPAWTADQRQNMGIAMLVIQAAGFLIFISVRLLLAMRTLVLTALPLLGGMFRGRRRRSGAPS